MQLSIIMSSPPHSSFIVNALHPCLSATQLYFAFMEGIASILDRKVELPLPQPETETCLSRDATSLYELCRSWVQNNPELSQMRPPVLVRQSLKVLYQG
jgi:hypothetical protein